MAKRPNLAQQLAKDATAGADKRRSQMTPTRHSGTPQGKPREEKKDGKPMAVVVGFTLYPDEKDWVEQTARSLQRASRSFVVQRSIHYLRKALKGKSPKEVRLFFLEEFEDDID